MLHVNPYNVCEYAYMDDYQKMIVDFLEEAVVASGLGTRTALARKLGLATTTLTRVGDPKSKNVMSLKTAWTISALTGVPVPQVTSSHPRIGDRIKDDGEVAWVNFWRRLEPVERQVMIRTHRIDPPNDTANWKTA